MTLPFIHETQHGLDNTKSIIELDAVLGILKGDIVMVGADTNNGAQVSAVRVGADFSASISGTLMTVASVNNGILQVGQDVTDDSDNQFGQIVSFGSGSGGAGSYNLDSSTTSAGQIMHTTAPELTFTRLGVGFSLSVWAAQASGTLAAYPPAQSVLVNYGTAYNTTSAILANVRGAPQFDPNGSLPAIETGNPSPSPVSFSTSGQSDLALFWIGCFVGPFGVAPWTDPAITGVNTVGPGTWDWVNGLNNTELLEPIALALYSSPVLSPVNSQSVSTTASMMGAAYLLTAVGSIARPRVRLIDASPSWIAIGAAAHAARTIGRNPTVPRRGLLRALKE